MPYRLRLELESIQCAIRALDILHRLNVYAVELETTVEDTGGFVLLLQFDIEDCALAQHIVVRLSQIVGVATAAMVEISEESPHLTFASERRAGQACIRH